MFYSEEFYIVYYIELHDILQYIRISVYFKHISKYTKTTFCPFLCILENIVNVVNIDFFYEVFSKTDNSVSLFYFQKSCFYDIIMFYCVS